MKLSLDNHSEPVVVFLSYLDPQTIVHKPSRFTRGLYGILIWCSAFTFIEFGTFTVEEQSIIGIPFTITSEQNIFPKTVTISFINAQPFPMYAMDGGKNSKIVR